MHTDHQRRKLIQGCAMVCIASTSGCLSLGNKAIEGKSWPAAARKIFNESEKETLREVGMPPSEIDSQTKARRATSIIGWYQGLHSMESDDLQPIKSFLQNVSDIEQTLGNVETKLSDVKEFITWMKETDLKGISLWDIAVTLNSSVRTFDTAVTESLSEVRDWLSLFSNVTGALEQSLELIQHQLQTQTGQPEELTNLGDTVDDAIESLEKLESKTEETRTKLSSVAEITETIATDAATTNEFGSYSDDIESLYRGATAVFGKGATNLKQFNEQLRSAQSPLSDLKSDVKTTREELYELIFGCTQVGSSCTRPGNG